MINTNTATFIETDLLKDEKIVCLAKLSKFTLAKPMTLFWSMAFCGIPLFLSYIKWSRSEFAVTDKRVLFKRGVFNISTEEHFFNKIETVKVNQDFLGSMFNYGTLVIVGSGGTSMKVDYLKDPLTFKKLLLEAIEKKNA